jgi:ribosome modulation factor
MTDDDQATAYQRGRAAGKSTDTFAGQCPYPHSRLNLRMAWMDGFGAGRDTSVEREIAQQDAGPVGTKSGG